jgi:hypothetical protein
VVNKQSVLRTLTLALALGTSCTKSPFGPPVDPRRQSLEAGLAEFERYWLEPAHIAPPTIDFIDSTQTSGALSVTLKPLLAERQPWNQWPGYGARLFNNRAAHLFSVTVHGVGRLKWLPEQTRLHINWPNHTLEPALQADELLEPLRSMALTEQQWSASTDFTKRHRAAGAYRSVYFPLDPRTHTLAGVLAFPIVGEMGHVVALQVDLAVQTEQGDISLSWIYD